MEQLKEFLDWDEKATEWWYKNHTKTGVPPYRTCPQDAGFWADSAVGIEKLRQLRRIADAVERLVELMD